MTSGNVAPAGGRRFWPACRGAALCALALSSLGVGAPAAAQPTDTPYLVRDIASHAADERLDSSLVFEQAVNGRASFWAASDSAGSRWTLWSTDGTAAGTSPISDLLAYEATNSLNASSICTDTQRWIFWASGSPGGSSSIWSTDATNLGTAMVTPLPSNSISALTYPGPEPCEERALDGRSLFWIAVMSALEGPTYELWSTDGTFAGTHRVAQLGQDPVTMGGIPDFIRLGDKILFSLQTIPNGFELWRTDGTEAGTEPFLTQLSGIDILAARGFARVGDWAFFVGSFSGGPEPLAVTDGTAAGTRVYADLLPLMGSTENGYEPVALPDRLVLAATSAGSTQLWAAIPTQLEPEVLTSLVGVISMGPLVKQAIGGRALFAVTLPEPPSDARDHLVVSDGTTNGTIDVAVGCDAAGSCAIGGLGTMGGDAYFLVSDSSGKSLWKTDGTAPGTAQIEVFNCASGCEIRPFGVSEAKLYFLKGLLGESPALWVTDGAEAGTFEVLAPGSIVESWTTGAGSVALPGNRLVFGAYSADSGFEPWITDGTPSGTHNLVNLSTTIDPAEPKRLTANGERVLFSARESVHGVEPWVSGGNEGSTRLVADVRPGVAGSDPVPSQPADGLWPMMADPNGSGSPYLIYYTNGAPGSLVSLGSETGWGYTSIAFSGRTLITSGVELSVFDGDPPSMSPLEQIGGGFNVFPFLAAGAQRVYFRNLLGEPHGLWATDGTQAGTQPFCEAPNYQSFFPGSWIGELGSGAVFKARTETEGVETYFCHAGEAAILLADIATGPADADPSGFVAVGGWSLFAATDSAGDRELWRTDGTVAGTSLLVNLSPSGSSAPAEFKPVVGGVIFTADDCFHGRELWFSDGTAAGTAMVADLAPGPMSSQPGDFEPIGGAYVFAAETLAAGRELWVTAGTSESTGPLPEILPGPLSSRPEELTATQHRVFFRATDSRGAELWALCPSWVPGTAQVCNELFSDGLEGGSMVRWSASAP